MNDGPHPESTDHIVTTVEDLQALYGEPSSRSLKKEIDYISDHYRAFIEAAPFVILASVGDDGLDCSPRGDPPGFIRVVDDKTLLIPDRRGNNRLDSLKNIIRDPRVSLLFLIPGIGETIRINGRAQITTNPELCESFQMSGKPPRSVIQVTVDRIYYQCPKALIRSRLWQSDAQIPRGELPTAGQIIQGLDPAFDGETHDKRYPEHVKETIY